MAFRKILKMTEKKRIDWLDAAKGVGILMIMFGHNWLDARCYFLFYPVAILCSLALICLLRQTRCLHWLLFIGANSLVYYGLHRLVIEFLFVVWGKCEVSYDGVSFLSLIISVINVIITCTILTPIVLFINKRCPWLLGKF